LKLAQQELGILFVKVTSAFHLQPQQKNKINLAIRKRFHNNKVYIYNIVDPSIIGGLKIESGSLSIDGTLRNRLNLIKEETYKTINSGEIMGEDYGI
jgi:F-type H+-transporting ATPase subunit delta